MPIGIVLRSIHPYQPFKKTVQWLTQCSPSSWHDATHQSVNMPHCHPPDQGGAVVLAEERGRHHSSVLGSNFHERLLLHLLHLRGGRSESERFKCLKVFPLCFRQYKLFRCWTKKTQNLFRKNINLNSAPAIPLESEAPPWFAVLEKCHFEFSFKNRWQGIGMQQLDTEMWLAL